MYLIIMQDGISVQPEECDLSQRGCVAAAATIIAAKWTPQILFTLANGVRRYSEIQKEVEGINPRTLSARLDELQTSDIITRTSYDEIPPRIEYQLTAKGKDLLPILNCMANWGDKYRPIGR